jgi:hypothetical protein
MTPFPVHHLFIQHHTKCAAHADSRFHTPTAKQKGMDVVLIDTAGRMQDNRRLMQALAKVRPTYPPDDLPSTSFVDGADSLSLSSMVWFSSSSTPTTPT